jgi:bacteriorhodopsin
MEPEQANAKMPRESTLALLIWTLLWAFGCGAAAVMLHSARRIGWSELALPVGGFLALQIALFGGILLAQKRRSRQLTSGLLGLCIWAEVTWPGYYAVRWRLIAGYTERDLRSFSEIMLVLVVIFALMPQRWMQRMGGIKCARCGHYHEGRDCSCGCRADQFKYPAFQPPS